MQESIIKMLYREFAKGETSRRCYLLNERVDTITKELKNMLSKNQVKKLERLCKDYETINLEDTENAFVEGFSFAVQILSEAYAHKEKKTQLIIRPSLS